MGEIMGGEATPAQIGGFLVALRAKGETADEIAGCAEAMREHALRFARGARTSWTRPGPGGRRPNAEHLDGRRDRRRGCGCGRRKAREPRRVVRLGVGGRARGARVRPRAAARADRASIDELGFGFMFAPLHHPAMKHAAPVRRELATRTVFNVLGPLTNPAGARAQIVGVYAPELVRTVGEVLARLGARRAFVVHGANGIDELSPAGSEPRVRGRRRRRPRADDRPARLRRPALRPGGAARRHARGERGGASGPCSPAPTAGAATRSC